MYIIPELVACRSLRLDPGEAAWRARRCCEEGVMLE